MLYAAHSLNRFEDLGFIVRDGKMGREEQIEEREVLDSIFPDEITGPSIVPSYQCLTTHSVFRYFRNLV